MGLLELCKCLCLFEVTLNISTWLYCPLLVFLSSCPQANASSLIMWYPGCLHTGHSPLITVHLATAYFKGCHSWCHCPSYGQHRTRKRGISPPSISTLSFMELTCDPVGAWQLHHSTDMKTTRYTCVIVFLISLCFFHIPFPRK